MRAIYFLSGGVKITAAAADAEKILNICMRYGFVYRYMMRKDDDFSLECSMYTADMLKQVCTRCEIKISIVKKYGLPYILSKYRKRTGLLSGLILAAALIICSELFLWDIRVTGCESIGEQAVIAELCDQNLGLGSYIPGLDVDIIENRVLINSPDISWISINLKGSVAYVEIREKVPEPPAKRNNPANLLAAHDGQIEAIEAEKGSVAVKVGQHVRRGDLLVSGVYDSAVFGYRYTRAAGSVFARTVRQIQVEIPLKYEVKSYTGDEQREIAVFFFSRAIKLYRNTGFLVGSYDTISNVENFCLFDGTRLPFSYETTTYRWYAIETAERDSLEATELAYDELNRRIAEFTENGATLLKKQISWSLTDDAYILDCTATLIENIAVTVEFEVLE